MADKTTTIDLELNDREAWALSQLVKRIGYVEISANAVDEDEGQAMRLAVHHLQQALARHGFNPR